MHPYTPNSIKNHMQTPVQTKGQNIEELKVGQQRRSVQQSNDAAEELKSKVSRMMTNNSQIIEDLKTKSNRRSVKAGDVVNQSNDRQSVDTLAHEIDAYGKTMEKEISQGSKKKGVASSQNAGSSRRGSTKRGRGESPLR